MMNQKHIKRLNYLTKIYDEKILIEEIQVVMFAI